MSFLTKAARGHDSSTPENNLEDTYMQLFPKIARDFVHRDDLIAILLALLAELGVEVAVDLQQDAGARARASEYDDLQAEGKLGSAVYPDVKGGA
jgi:hypothetical protein